MDLSQLTGHIWLDGEMVPWQDARVHVLTHTFHYGLGCFEGVRAYKTPDGTAIFRLNEHTDRLFRSAHILRRPVSCRERGPGHSPDACRSRCTPRTPRTAPLARPTHHG